MTRNDGSSREARRVKSAVFLLAFGSILVLAATSLASSGEPPREPEKRASVPSGPTPLPGGATPEEPGNDPSEEGLAIEDPASPRAAVRAFLEACRAGDFGAASAFLDLRVVPEAERAREAPALARRLKVVLDRKLWVDLDRLSGLAAGNPDDGLALHLDHVGTIGTRRGPVDILVRRPARADADRVWRFAPETVRRIPALYSEFGYGRIGEILPAAFFDARFLEIELWQWIGLFLVLLAAVLASGFATWIAWRIARPFVSRTETHLDDRICDLARRPVQWALVLLFFSLGARALRLSVPVHRFLTGFEKGLAVIAVTWLLTRIVHVAADELAERLERKGRRSILAMIPLGRRALKIVLLLIAAVALLQDLGFNVTGLVAGLGVGGLAVALAAQKTLENLFGGVMLSVDQPVRVGDFCRFGDRVGTVEDVGLRSTRIRTLDRTVVTVPNGELSRIELENFAMRDRIRLQARLGLRYETTPDQLRHVLAEIRKLLAAHPKIASDPARARFVELGSHSLDVEVFAYVLTQDWNEFLAVQEDVLLRLLDVVEQSGTGFAFPSQTLYLGRDSGLDDARRDEAERAVRSWRAEGKLPFPDLPPEWVARLENSLDYPPEGSPAKSEAR